MKIWNQDNYIKAWNFACRAHQGQTMFGSPIPYVNHVGLVAMEALGAIASEEIRHPDLLVQCALLHDTVEDTDITLEELEGEFGPQVAAGVAALSKDKTLPTKLEQMQDSIRRIKAQPGEVWMVKLADRITNLQPPPAHWTRAKCQAYREEARLILAELGEASPMLSARLKNKIDGYEEQMPEE